MKGEASNDERQEKHGQETLSRASVDECLAIGCFDRDRAARATTVANLQGVASGIDRHRGRVIHLNVPDRHAVDEDVVGTTPNLDADRLVDHFQGCRHRQRHLLPWASRRGIFVRTTTSNRIATANSVLPRRARTYVVRPSSPSLWPVRMSIHAAVAQNQLDDEQGAG